MKSFNIGGKVLRINTDRRLVKVGQIYTVRVEFTIGDSQYLEFEEINESHDYVADHFILATPLAEALS
jgi:hypothetical protein